MIIVDRSTHDSFFIELYDSQVSFLLVNSFYLLLSNVI